MTYEDYKNDLLPFLPNEPGVYRFLDENDHILYVGKAKNLKNRVSSYFGDKKHQLPKTRVLVKNAHRLVFTIVSSEQDALLLESTLIKEHQPRYNVMLKDGKIYPYIVIKKERFPRVFITRRIIRDGSYYFGPYVQPGRIHAIMEMVKQLFPLRNCTLNLTQENIDAGKFRVCLEYHVKNCAGPCQNHESEENYNLKIEQIKYLLKGNFAAIQRHFKQEMLRAAERLDFESAQHLKVNLEAFENYQAKSTVVNPSVKDADVFSIDKDDKFAYINYMKVANGAIINTYTQEIKLVLEEEVQDLLELAIPTIVEKFQSFPHELIVPFKVDVPDPNWVVTVPKAGDKKKLLELSEKNVKYHALNVRKALASKEQKMTPAERILRQLQKDLSMDKLPLHIECFDNSNIQGTNPVSAMVCFKNAKPAKSEYRHYNVKTVEGPDDFATMYEVVTRRYKRLKEEDKPFPQLVVIDGGKGQLASAVQALKDLNLYGQMTIIGIAKRLEELYFPEDPLPLMLDKKSESLKLIQQLRNEAHRFGITFHRDQRSRKFISTSLTSIPGIGKTTADKLIKHFGSVKKVMEASDEELVKVVGKSVAGKLRGE